MAAVALTSDFTRTSTATEMTLHDKWVLVCHADNFNHFKRHHSAEKCNETIFFIFFKSDINLYIYVSSAITTRKGLINRIHVQKWLLPIPPPINRYSIWWRHHVVPISDRLYVRTLTTTVTVLKRHMHHGRAMISKLWTKVIADNSKLFALLIPFDIRFAH